MNPQLRALLDLNPQLREMMQNPEFVRQLTSPETMQVYYFKQSAFFFCPNSLSIIPYMQEYA